MPVSLVYAIGPGQSFRATCFKKAVGLELCLLLFFLPETEKSMVLTKGHCTS